MSDPHPSTDHPPADQDQAAEGAARDRIARAQQLANLQDSQDTLGGQGSQAGGASRDDTQGSPISPISTGGPEQPPAATLQPLFPDVESWVRWVFAPTFVRRRTSTFRWCAQWWRHPEAIVRLESMWRSWELLRLDPTTGASVWLVHHLDPQLPILTGPAGPFADCDSTRHENGLETGLPVQDAEPGWWG